MTEPNLTSYTLPDEDGVRRVANDYFGDEFGTPSLQTEG